MYYKKFSPTTFIIVRNKQGIVIGFETHYVRCYSGIKPTDIKPAIIKPDGLPARVRPSSSLIIHTYTI